jgi:hypothetical protein
MSYVMPEIGMQRILQYGIQYLRANRPIFNEIFAYLSVHPLMASGYGQTYIDRIWTWFTTEKIPVVQAFLMSPERVPCFSIHLSSETEDESKAGISDFYGDDEENEMGVNVFNVNLDIGIHGSKVAEEVLWMYYIASDILFRHKTLIQSMGIELQTYTASDWQRDNTKNPENLFTRWLRMRLTVVNSWNGPQFEGPYDLLFDINVASTMDSQPIVHLETDV